MKSVSATPVDSVNGGMGITAGEPVMSDEKVRSAIANIASLGAVEDTFEVLGHTFRMHALTERELIDATSRATAFRSGRAENMAFRAHIVALSIDEVDGRPLYTPLSQEEDVGFAKSEKVFGWYPAVVDELYSKYVELANRSDELVRAEKKS